MVYMNTPPPKLYDLILVIEYFRSVSYYLSIIKYLAKDFEIGMYVVPMDPGLLAKNKHAQEQFVELCVSLGGELISDVTADTRLLLIPQRPYIDAAKDLIFKIKSDKKVGMLALAWAGIAEHDAFLDYFNIDIVFVIDRTFLGYLLKNRTAQATYQKKKIIEVGCPFVEYPVFEDVVVDYMIAMPTGFSFAHESDKWSFMETVLALFSTIEPEAIVVLKAHNGMDRDQFSRPRYRWLAVVFGLIPGFGGVVSRVAFFSKKFWIGRYFGLVYTSYLYEKVLKRAVSFSSISDYYQISMEVFLPSIKKGVIGGLSNTIWGSLFAKIPYYNCVDIAIQRRDSKDRLYGEKDPTNLLDLNLGYFNVPYCQGRLAFDSENYKLLADSTRDADLVSEIRSLLQ